MYPPKTFLNVLKTFILLFVLIGFLAGCGAKYGGLQRSHSVDLVFQEYDLLPDHQYYSYGGVTVPHAIAGIHSNFLLQAEAWEPVAPSREQFKTWINKMNAVYGDAPNGAFILGPDKTKLGIWYSSYRYAKIEMDEENRIITLLPQFTYEGGGK